MSFFLYNIEILYIKRIKFFRLNYIEWIIVMNIKINEFIKFIDKIIAIVVYKVLLISRITVIIIFFKDINQFSKKLL